MNDLRTLLNSLKQRADLPRDATAEAQSLPPAVYHDAELLALEEDRIFSRDWLCAGRADEIAAPGDYLTFSIGKQPIFCIRQADGEIRAFANVCRHRMMKLLEGRGSAKRFACPYHGWVYDMTGQAVRIPHMPKQDDPICLPEIRVEIWQGWIYVTANAHATPVAEKLAALEPMVARYRQEDYVSVVTEDHRWATNWKVLTENFMEGYHLPIAHRKTVGAWFSATEVTFPEERHSDFTYQIFAKDMDATYGVAHPDNTHLTDKWRNHTVMPTVFPCHMYILAPDHLWYLSLRPDGPGHTHIRFGVAIAPEVKAAWGDDPKPLADLTDFFARVNAEDRALVESVTANASAPLSTPGPLSWTEHELRDYHGYLASRLVD